VSTITLTFTVPTEAHEAQAAIHGLRSIDTLHRIDQLARTCLKHDGDARSCLEEIRGQVTEAMEGLE
jgi:hypothetical protein